MSEAILSEARRHLKFQMHVSGLLLQESCGEAFRRRYIEGEKVPPSVALAVGGAVHRTVRRDLVNKKERQALLARPEVVQIARDELVGAWDKYGVLLAEEEVEAGALKVQGQAIDKTVGLAGLHHDEMGPKIEPVHVEREFVLDMAGIDWQFAGTIDIQEATAIRDTKTASKSPSMGDAAKSMQLLSYALAVQVLDGARPKRGSLDTLVETKTKRYKAVDECSFEGADFRPFLERVEAAYRAIQAGIFVPANPNDWRCSARYCGFYPTCRYALRPVTIPLVQIAPVNGTAKEGR